MTLQVSYIDGGCCNNEGRQTHIKGCEVPWIYHGVKPEERKLGQKFLVDVDAWLDLQPAGESDCLSDTVSYTDIYRIVKEVVEGPAHNLLESVAQLVASTTLTKHPQISAVRVKVGKPHVAVPGSVDYLGVEILRYRRPELP
uniref:7,8-dihydroneopterin aldolase n=1 Tax=Fagus sylvatica TaxID=28930 RepID=A0A2N9I6P7_FAGSY